MRTFSFPKSDGPPATRRLAVALAAGLTGAGLLLTPAVAFAATTPAVQTTDPAGDAHAFGQRNVAAADILAAGIRVEGTTVTFFTRLAATPTQAQLANSSTRYTTGARIGAAGAATGDDVLLTTTIGNGVSGVAVGGPGLPLDEDSGLPTTISVSSTLTVDALAGELDLTVGRADLDAAVSIAGNGGRPLGPGALLRVDGATSKILPPTNLGGALFGEARDSASAGPVTTFTG